MNQEEAAQAIRAEMQAASSLAAKAFWKGVLVGLSCGTNLNFALMKDLAEAQGDHRQPAAYP